MKIWKEFRRRFHRPKFEEGSHHCVLCEWEEQKDGSLRNVTILGKGN